MNKSCYPVFKVQLYRKINVRQFDRNDKNFVFSKKSLHLLCHKNINNLIGKIIAVEKVTNKSSDVTGGSRIVVDKDGDKDEVFL